MTEGNEIKQELVRTLFQTAEIWEKLRETHRHQLDSLAPLKTYDGNEIWFRDTKNAIITLASDENTTNERGDGFLRFQESLKRLETIGLSISGNLILETTALISKVHLPYQWLTRYLMLTGAVADIDS